MNPASPQSENGARANWLAALILICGATLRLWQLGEFPFHPDEAIHAWFSLDLSEYHYDPVYHGPLLYHLTAGAFALLGSNDFSARFIPAACGIILLLLVLFPTRKYLGTRAALWAGIFLTFSPVVVAYSRRLLHDSLVLSLTLGAVLCFQMALENPSSSRAGRTARVGLAVILALFLATKANVFFIFAMLFAFWIWHLLLSKLSIKKLESEVFDFVTPLLCVCVALATFAILFRSDSLRALPAMIGYWGGQQRAPRLPGPHDYYFRLFLLYELPLFIMAIWGAVSALIKRTAFTDLLLWWSFTSLVLYAVANEKVPWLLAHQVLPLALLAGYGLVQIEWRTTPKKLALAAVVFIAAVFSIRHIIATNWENAADRHEPLFYAQTTESYRNALFDSLQQTREFKERGVWVEPAEQWPPAWYAREKAAVLEGSTLFWNDEAPDQKTVRLIIASPGVWESLQKDGRFAGWNYVAVEHYVWPRPAWSALSPRTFWRFWARREASLRNGVLEKPKEEILSAYSVFATPPRAATDKDFSSIR